MSRYGEILDKGWVNESSISKFKDLECVIFDCDGTLVNINNSYNQCIKHTTGFILERLTGGYQWYNLVNEDIILKFRISGGFNNDIDTTYATILSAVASGKEEVEDVQKFVADVAEHADERGTISIEEYLSASGFNRVVEMIKHKLRYPGPVGSSLLCTAFDEFFYGKELFLRMHGREPVFNNSYGFIDKDEVIISSESAQQISSMFNGKIAIVSGRSRLATEYTLKPILHHFDLNASVFIEDEEKKIDNSFNYVRKPSPYSLMKSIETLNIDSALCAGDSVEDILMARKVSEIANTKTVFCGIYGTVTNRDLQLKIFRENNIDAIIENVNILPSFLNILTQ